MTKTPDTSAGSTSTTTPPARWYSSSSGFASIGAVLVITAGLLAGLFGFGHADHTVRFLRGNAWLTNDETGSVVRVNGATGKPDFEMKFKDAAGDDLEVIQGPDGVFVLDRTTGDVTKLDDAQLRVGATIHLDDPTDQPLFLAGGAKAYLVGRSSGRVQQVDPAAPDLADIGPPVELGHPVANALVDDRGRLIAALPDTGELAFVIDGRRDAPVHVAEPGNKLTVSLVADQLVAIDHTRGTIAPVDPTTGILTLITLDTPAGTELAVADKMTGNRLWLAVGTATIVGVELRTGAQLTIRLADADHGIGAPLPNGDFVYVPDYERGDLVKIDIARAAPVDRVPVSGAKGRFESFVKDDRVWGNDPVGQLAVVIDHDGNAQKIEKYRPGLPTNDDGFGDPPATTPPTVPATTPATVPPASSTTTSTAPNTAPTVPERPDLTAPPFTTSTTRPASSDPAPPGGPATPNLPSVPAGPNVPGGPGGPGGPPADATTTTTTPASPTTPPNPPAANVPGAPGAVVATAGDASVSLMWGFAADNGSALLHYTVLVATVPGTPGATATSVDVPAGQTSTVVSGLTNGLSFTASVQAVNAIGTGPATSSTPFTPTALTISAPDNLVADLVVDSASPTGQTLIRLRWNQPLTHPELVHDFDYACYEQTGSLAPIFTRIPANTPSYNVTVGSLNYLTADGYTCSVHAIDSSGVDRSQADLPNANTVWPFRAPDAPTGLTNSIVIPGGSLPTDPFDTDLSWVIGFTGGRPLGSISVEVEVFDGSMWSWYAGNTLAGTATTYHLNAPGGSTYRFRIIPHGLVDGPTGIQFDGPASPYHDIA